jgi:hypothetical protein
MGIGLGLYLLYRGIKGDIWRSSFTGDPVVPQWLYIACGTFLVMGGIGLFIGVRLLIQSQQEN